MAHPTTNDRSVEWASVFADYQAATMIATAIDCETNEAAFDVAAQAQGSAIEALLTTPAPDLEAVATKLKIACHDGYQHLISPILTDVEQLTNSAMAPLPAEENSGATEECRGCRFWFTDDQQHDLSADQAPGRFGWCRRYPPTIVGHWPRRVLAPTTHGGRSDRAQEPAAVRDRHAVGLYPATFGHQWCGAFAPARAA